ncbi:MAG: biotin/lipoyl-containing protein [Bacillota bacterium]
MDVKARVPGKIVEVRVNVGDVVKARDILAVEEAMKMQQPIPCPQDGVIKEIRVNVGDRVSSGDVIAVVE